MAMFSITNCGISNTDITQPCAARDVPCQGICAVGLPLTSAVRFHGAPDMNCSHGDVPVAMVPLCEKVSQDVGPTIACTSQFSPWMSLAIVAIISIIAIIVVIVHELLLITIHSSPSELLAIYHWKMKVN